MEVITKIDYMWLQLLLESIKTPADPLIKAFKSYRIDVFIRGTIQEWDDNFDYIGKMDSLSEILKGLFKEVQDKVYYMKSFK